MTPVFFEKQGSFIFRLKMSKMRTCLYLIFLVFPLLIGCDFIYGIIQKQAAHEKALIGEIVPFMQNEKVEEIQKLLKVNGEQPLKAHCLCAVSKKPNVLLKMHGKQCLLFLCLEFLQPK